MTVALLSGAVEPAAAVTPQTPTPGAEPTPPVSPTPEGAWYAGIPEPFRADPNITKYPSQEEFFKGHINAVKKLGEKSEGLVKIPAADAKPEEVAAWRKALGVPDTPEGYTLDVAEPLREIVPVDSVKAYAPVFHRLNIPPAAAQELVTAHATLIQQQLTDLEASLAAGREALRKEWGEATWTHREGLAEQAVNTLLSEEQVALLSRPGLRGHPEIIKLFSSLGEKLSEARIIQADTTFNGRTKPQAESRVKEIETNGDFLRGKHPEQAKLEAERAQLYRFLYPEAIK